MVKSSFVQITQFKKVVIQSQQLKEKDLDANRKLNWFSQNLLILLSFPAHNSEIERVGRDLSTHVDFSP